MSLFSLNSCLMALAGSLTACQPAEPQAAVSAQQATPPDTAIYFTIASVGDLMCHSTQYNYARIEGDSFDFDPAYAYVQQYLTEADLLLGNLETTLAGPGKPYSGYPQFNTPDAYATALRNAGFDCIVTANNHSNDTGEKGILRTIQVLDSLGLAHTGTYTSAADRDSVRILEVQGVRIGILAYSYSTNGLPLTEGKPWLVNLCDTALIARDLQRGRQLGAELMLVVYHFGDEYQRLPNAYQKDLVQFAINHGADIVLGSHPHVLQPTAFYPGKGSTVDSVFVAWSMGNFISNQQDEYTDEGVIIRLRLMKDLRTGKINVVETAHVPTWVYKGKLPDRKQHTVFPVTDTTFSNIPAFILDNYRSELEKALRHSTDILYRPVPLSEN